MTSTYTLSDKLRKDFLNTCKVKGLPASKTLRRLVALFTLEPQNFNKINSSDFLQKVVNSYGAEDL